MAEDERQIDQDGRFFDQVEQASHAFNPDQSLEQHGVLTDITTFMRATRTTDPNRFEAQLTALRQIANGRDNGRDAVALKQRIDVSLPGEINNLDVLSRWSDLLSRQDAQAIVDRLETELPTT